MGCKDSWVPTKASGEAGTNRTQNPVNSRGANMCSVSHLSTGLATLEEGNDELLGVWGHVYLGGR